MLAQAEHDVDASAILLTTSKRLASAVAKEVERRWWAADRRGRGEIDRAEFRDIVVRSLTRRWRFNRFAPEHLSIPDASLLPG